MFDSCLVQTNHKKLKMEGMTQRISLKPIL
jgi:hypothetical protein